MTSDRNNVAPRLGFAYALNAKTSIRAGAGIFYTLSRATVAGHTGSPFNTDSGMTFTLDSGATQYAKLSNPYPNGLTIPLGSSLGDKTFLGRGAGTIVRSTGQNPEMYSWNVSLQREVGWDSVLEINYTGSRGLRLYNPYTSLTPLDPSYWGIGRTALQAKVPNPFYGVITDPQAAEVLVRGGAYFPEFTRARVAGCSLGGSFLKLRGIYVGFRVELLSGSQTILTSPVQSISVNPDPATPHLM